MNSALMNQIGEIACAKGERIKTDYMKGLSEHVSTRTSDGTESENGAGSGDSDTFVL